MRCNRNAQSPGRLVTAYRICQSDDFNLKFLGVFLLRYGFFA